MATKANSPAALKPKMRIVQSSGFLLDLVKQATHGRIVPAAFQRPYVWEKDDVLALCNSIREGYPIGAFLTWIPGRNADLSTVARSRIGPIVALLDHPAHALLLDGQNRLATVAWMLRDEATMPMPANLSAAEARTWNSGQTLVVDLAAQDICFVDSDQADIGFRLPSRTLFPGTDNMKLVRERWSGAWSQLSEDERNVGLAWYYAVQSQFYEARIVETVLENATVEQAKRAFMHICKVGVPMSEADFNAALAWAVER